jgi:1,4-alpha-glucan branching enzyme
VSQEVRNKIKNGNLMQQDILLFHEGKNYISYRFMGSHLISENRRRGARLTTWAPKAKEIYVVGDFCDFQPKEEFKMKKINDRGLWSVFIPGLRDGDIYKYFIVSENVKEGFYKSDPYARFSEIRPNTASIIKDEMKFRWGDKKWLIKRDKVDLFKEPINIYEIHLGSWKRNKDNFLTYEELCEELPKYLVEMGYTHVEFMPVVEHPLDASWGYQVTGYYSVTSRYGNPKEFKKLINALHRNNIGVILDWVPGHFCKNDNGLYKFDGTPTYEYEEEWKAENTGWGTANFDLGRPEVKSFLISNALYWIREFHVDGLRVDAVSNMLYLNYGRKDGEWKPNKYGNNGCLEGVEFLKDLNLAISSEFRNILMIAEESTTWPNVTKPVKEGGLGFIFKWNMGWMNDTLKYVEIDPIYRKNNHNNMTFSIMYNYTENFILPLSHDEVVHGKKSIVDKMWGDYWNKFAGFRLYLAYMIGHPGKKLAFMGYEFAQFIEWREYEALEWKLLDEFEMHKKAQSYIKDLNKLYKSSKALYELDYDKEGFEWIDADNNKQSIYSFVRKGSNKKDTLVFICNFTPIVYYDFKVGVPYYGEYKEIFNSDNKRYGGSNQLNEEAFISEKKSFHNKDYSIKLKIPPMAVSILSYEKIEEKEKLEPKEISFEELVVKEVAVDKNI